MEMRTLEMENGCDDVDIKLEPLEPDTDDWVSLVLNHVLLKC